MKQRLRCALVAGIVSVIGGYGVQAMRDNSDQNAPVDPAQAHLRPPPPQVSDEPSILVLTPAFRDGARCGKTLLSALMNADHPELLRFSIYDQVTENVLKLTRTVFTPVAHPNSLTLSLSRAGIVARHHLP